MFIKIGGYINKLYKTVIFRTNEIISAPSYGKTPIFY